MLSIVCNFFRCPIPNSGAVTKVNLRRSEARRVGMTLTMFLNCLLQEIGVVKEWVGVTVEKFSRIYWPVPN